LFGGWLVTEHEDVDERSNRRGERDREDNPQSAEQHSHDPTERSVTSGESPTVRPMWGFTT